MVDSAFRMFDQAGKLVRQIDLDFAKFGADRVVYHRQDLHTALKKAATSPDLAGKPVEIRTAAKVTACDPDKGTITLDDGETLEADIVIGADGIHSVLRRTVVGEPREAIPTGTSAYRMLLPAECLSGLDVPKDILDLAKPVTTMIVGHDRRIIMGPGRGGKVFGIVALVPDEHMHETSPGDSWVAPGSMPALLKAFAGFPDWLLDMFQRAPDLALWQLRDIDPLPRWVRGRAILVGDAAHAMLPTQGQGASQAIEDAEALQSFLADLPESPTAEQVNGALLRVYEARHERASLIQQYSREQARPGTEAGSNKVKLDPVQFMEYNCNYSGAKDWVAKKELSVAAEKLRISGD
jgi:salicylate hydroxylase